MIKLYIGTVILIKSGKSTKVLLISVLQSLNGAQFLNAACVAAVSGCSTAVLASGSAAIVLVTVIFPVTKTYASE